MSAITKARVTLAVDTTGAQEAQATIGSTANAAKEAQRSFADLQAEQQDAYVAVGDLATESTQQIAQLTESFTKLRAEMATLPDALKIAVDGVIDSLKRGDAGAARPQEMRVTVVHQGLDQIEVRGLEGQSAARFKEALRSMTNVLSEELTAVSEPSSHVGFG